jgi:hypothetical protein
MYLPRNMVRRQKVNSRQAPMNIIFLEAVSTGMQTICYIGAMILGGTILSRIIFLLIKSTIDTLLF